MILIEVPNSKTSLCASCHVKAKYKIVVKLEESCSQQSIHLCDKCLKEINVKVKEFKEKETP